MNKAMEAERFMTLSLSGGGDPNGSRELSCVPKLAAKIPHFANTES
jgi:hypothetical protein